jgi:hypothetical protein
MSLSAPPIIPPRKHRLQSTVRVRRSHGSPFADFIDRHFSSGSSRHSDSNSSAPTGSTTADSNQQQQTDKVKRPRLGNSDGDGRRGSSRSVIENLAAQDRVDYLESTSGANKSSPAKSRARGRATDGHEPQLAQVAEDDVSPGSSTAALQPAGVIYEADEGAAEGSASIDSATSQQAIVPSTPQQEQAGVSPKRRAFSTSAFTVTKAGQGEARSNEMTSSNDSSTRSGETRFLTPPSTGRRSSPLPEDTESSSIGSPKDSRLRIHTSNVSIPTPIEEESRSRDEQDYDVDHHTDDVADYLDVVDPEVGALGYLSNIGNSIFFPHIPALYDRRPTHNLPSSRRRGMSMSTIASQRRSSLNSATSRHSRHSSNSALEEGRGGTPEIGKRPSLVQRASIMSRVSSAVGWNRKEDDEEFVKHIKDWREMDEEERDELDEHVRMLLTKKSKFKRGAKGFYAFVKTPMGFIMTLYGFLVTFWGTAIVLFIFGWIHVGGRKRYWIEICDQILCALFAAVGLGFAPFRAVDTYRMIHIAHYHHLTWKRRKQLGLDELNDPNDLPRPINDGSNQVSRMMTPTTENGDALPVSNTSSEHSSMNRSDTGSSNSRQKKHHKHLIHHKKTLELPSEFQKQADASALESNNLGVSKAEGQTPALKRNESIQSELIKEREDLVVLTKGEQEVLTYHQRKFHASHTFYRYHATSTHHAFPLDLMIVITCLLDCHSLLQATLGGCTWGIKYTHRPTALTATLISCSLSCNAVAGLIIWLGGRKTKKREEVERRLRIALEQEALAKIERRRARGELPERGDHHTPDEKTKAEDKLAAYEKRDDLAKELGHLERSSSVKATTPKKVDTTSMEMSSIKTTAEGALIR